MAWGKSLCFENIILIKGVQSKREWRRAPEKGVWQVSCTGFHDGEELPEIVDDVVRSELRDSGCPESVGNRADGYAGVSGRFEIDL